MLNLHKKYVTETYDENNIIKKYSVDLPKTFNFAYDVIDELGKNSPERRAMFWCNDSGEEHTFTFSQMMAYSNKMANIFTSYGIKKGDYVMLVLKRHYLFWFSILALHKIGAIAIPATNLLTAKDYVYRFNSAEVKAVVCVNDDYVTNNIINAIPNSPTLKLKFISDGKKDGFISIKDELDNASEKFERVPTYRDEHMLLYFTSGTTGNPKMVRHKHSYSAGHIFTAKHWHNIIPDGLHLTLSDSGWAKSAWGKIYGQWFMEAGLFVCDFEKFTPADLLPLFEKYQITTFCAPPTIFRMFIKENLSKFNLSSLKYATIAGEALNPEVYNKFFEATGVKLMEAFGQTETTVLVANTVGMEPKPGSMGTPSPQYDVHIVDENGNDVDPGAVGEIIIKIPDKNNAPYGIFDGYYKEDNLTDNIWYDGIYHTGDTAWKDEDGYFWYVGRTDDIIKSSGYRIGPFEIESVLMEHPSVLECAITGVPDDLRGQIIKATVVLSKGYSPSEELKLELQNYVKNKTAPYKYPRILEFIDEMPKTISGKIRRKEIRDTHDKDK